MMSVTPPGRPEHQYTNDPLNMVLEYIPPDVGAGNNKSVYSYNADRQIMQMTRPDGVTIDFGYDNAGRLESITIPRGPTGFSYYPITGNLSTVTAPDEGTITYTYDGSLVKKVEWQGAVAGSIDRTYDNNFRLTSRKVNGANEIIFGYDNDGLLMSAGSLNFVRDLQNGLIQTSTLGHIIDSRNYSSFGEVDTYSASFQTNPIYNLQFVRDKTGRITQKTETIGGVASIYGYSYDAAGRLTAVKINETPYSSYTYDSNSNRLTQTRGATTVNGTYDAQDRMTQYGSTTYTYTANGELQSKTTSGQTTTYSYDALGNLMNVNMPDGTQIEYLIDGLNRRIGKKVNGTVVQRFLYYDESPVAELDGSGNVLSLFVYAGGGAVPAYMVQEGTAYRIITDHLGSVRLVVNSSTGTIAQRIDYDEFGNILNDTNPGFQPFGFAGGLYDQHTKLTRFGARDYDAETGRWTAKDPIGFSGLDSNLYCYVFNNPVNFTDPDGFGALEIIGGVLAAVADLMNPLAAINQGVQNTVALATNLVLEKMDSSYSVPYLELNPIVNVWGYSSPDMEPLIDTESFEFKVSRLVAGEVLGFAACIGGKAGLAADAIDAAETAARQARIAARKTEWMNKQAEFTQRSIDQAAKNAKAARKPVKIEHKGYGGTKGFRSGIGGIHK